MATQTEHGSQLDEYRKAILSPLGCKQVGHSRTWIADQRFWVIVVEFQPSSFSKGSYLNVGVTWLWDAKNHWSFDYGGRVETFTRYENSTQFETVAEALAIRAAEELTELRGKFASLLGISRHLVAHSGVSVWPLYHAAVATGLAGDVATSQRLFRELTKHPCPYDWQARVRANGAALAQYLPALAAFRAGVLAVIEKSRTLHRLPPDPGCLDAI